jgi:hypothetical protein
MVSGGRVRAKLVVSNNMDYAMIFQDACLCKFLCVVFAPDFAAERDNTALGLGHAISVSRFSCVVPACFSRQCTQSKT